MPVFIPPEGHSQRERRYAQGSHDIRMLAVLGRQRQCGGSDRSGPGPQLWDLWHPARSCAGVALGQGGSGLYK